MQVGAAIKRSRANLQLFQEHGGFEHITQLLQWTAAAFPAAAAPAMPQPQSPAPSGGAPSPPASSTAAGSPDSSATFHLLARVRASECYSHLRPPEFVGLESRAVALPANARQLGKTLIFLCMLPSRTERSGGVYQWQGRRGDQAVLDEGPR